MPEYETAATPSRTLEASTATGQIVTTGAPPEAKGAGRPAHLSDEPRDEMLPSGHSVHNVCADWHRMNSSVPCSLARSFSFRNCYAMSRTQFVGIDLA